ncbi:Vault protein inter-alpha-trypsin domain [Pelomyxa schiedti]|nr:Vault protein inter-alpha-trypsin domain [Pelomyxa schiedti]
MCRVGALSAKRRSAPACSAPPPPTDTQLQVMSDLLVGEGSVPAYAEPPPTPIVSVPLTGVRFEVEILDFCAHVTLHQRFENRENDPLEVVYEFILGDDVSVSAFVADIEGKKVSGVVQEKQKAKELYDDSIASGGGAFLVEESTEQSNMFTVNIGNLPPQKEALISLSYVCNLDTLPDGTIRFCLPGTPANIPLQISTPTLSTIYFKEVGASGISIRASLDMSSPISNAACNTHTITVEPGEKPTKAIVTLAEETFAPGKDFELLIQLAPTNEINCRVQQSEQGDKVAMLTFFPKLEGDVVSECIFVVDRSGSMEGEPIEQVKQTLQIFLRSLPEGTRFNIIGFGTYHVTLFSKGSAVYNEETLDTASKYVVKMSANLGGTNIMGPLKSIFSKKPTPGIPRQVFLLTDGQISDTEECIAAVRGNASTTRVFTYGIGKDVDRKLVRGLAKAGNGECELIQDTQSMNQKVLRLLNKALQPALTDVTLNWGALTGLQQTPYILRPLFGGSALVVYGFLPTTFKSTTTVALKAGSTRGPLSLKVSINPDVITPGSQLFKLAAKNLINDFEEGTSFLHVGGRNPSANAIKAEEIAISLKYQILCKHTAFVAIDKRTGATEGTMQLREMRLQPAPQPAFTIGRMASSTSSSSFGSGKMYDVDPDDSLFDEAECDNFGLGSLPPPSSMVSLPPSSKSSGPPPPPVDLLCSLSSLSLNCMQSSPLPPPPAPAKAFSPSSSSSSSSSRRSSSSLSAPTHHASAMPSQPLPSQAPAKPKLPLSKLPDILMQQKANGSWPESCLKFCEGLDITAVKAALPSSLNGKPDPMTLWITIVICAHIQSKYQDNKLEWNLIVTKALKWVEKQIGGPVSDITAAAKNFLQQQHP